VLALVRPAYPFNNLVTEREPSGHTGIATLLKGLFIDLPPARRAAPAPLQDVGGRADQSELLAAHHVPLTQLYSYDYAYSMGAGSDGVGEALLALAALAVRRVGRKLSLTEASTLATLERTGPRRVTDLAAAEGVTQPSMTAVVTQLQHLGLADRRSDPADGRVVLVALTTAGRRHLTASRRAGASVFTALIEKLPEQDAATLSAAVPALRRLLQLADASREPR
jgi:DNA-binding MarR family transcriptional regulator